jgi:probable phosphoglycerate mutase
MAFSHRPIGVRYRVRIESLRRGGIAFAQLRPCADERLREKEFGILDGLTRQGIEQNYSDQARYRTLLGKFYHRPPGGESWCDVILRSLLHSLALRHAGERILIIRHQASGIRHQVGVLCLRYLLEQLSENQILAIDQEGDVANCAITEYRRSAAGGLCLVRYNSLLPLEAMGAPVTHAADKKGTAP